MQVPCVRCFRLCASADPAASRPIPLPQVGWWDSRASCWSTADISEITYDPATRLLAFCSTHIGALALLQSRVRATPYYSWSVRPTGGENGKVAEVTLQVGVARLAVGQLS